MIRRPRAGRERQSPARAAALSLTAIVSLSLGMFAASRVFAEEPAPQQTGAAEGEKATTDETPEPAGDAALKLPELPRQAWKRLGSHGAAAEGEEHSRHESISGVAISPDGSRIATHEGIVRLWDRATGKLERTLGERMLGGGVAFSPDGQVLVAIGRGELALAWKVADGSPVWRAGSRGQQVRFSQAGKQVVVGGPEAIEMFKAGDGQLIEQQGAPPGFIGLSPGGEIVATKPRLGAPLVRLMTLDDDNTTQVLEEAEGVRCAAFTPDLRRLAGAGDSRQISLWSLDQPLAVRRFGDFTPSVWSLAVSRDGRWLASGHADGSLRLWELASAQLVQTWEGHAAHVRALAFSDDGLWLATGSSDQTAVVWRAGPFPEPGDAAWSDAAGDDLWRALGADNGADAWRVMQRLVADPARGVSWLRARLQALAPSAPEPDVASLLRDLDDANITIRDLASRQLIPLRFKAEKLFQQALKDSASAEVRFRLRRILSLPAPLVTTAQSEQLRLSRVVYVLEQIGSDDALAAIRDLSRQTALPAAVAEAQAALARLTPAIALAK